MRLVSLLNDEKEEVKLRQQAKAKRLNEAAMAGSVTLLLELLEEDPDILNKTISSRSETPLYVAVLLGHSAFAKQLLTQKPELATELNTLGSTALHAAAAKGYVEIVKELLLANPEICFVQDGDGRTPLHLAAIKGRIEALTELVRVKPEATRVLTGGGESVVNLCVKNNRLGALKALVESVGKDDHQFVNWRDSEGNSVLHIAVAKKQLETIKYLLTDTMIEVNARNVKGFTALDLLLHSQRDIRDMEIKECLEKAGGSRSMTKSQSIENSQDIEEVLAPTTLEKPPSTKKTDSKPVVEKHKHTDWLGRKRSALMVVASLLATVAFQASLSPPGGVWQDDYTVDSNGNPIEDPHKAGLSVMAYTDPEKYEAFMILNTLAFIASLSIILLLISGLPLKKRRFMWIQMVIMWIAISAFTSTYYVALIEITPRHVKATLFSVTIISLLIGLAMIGLVFIGNVIRMCLWLLREYGYIKAKEKEHSLYAEDEDNDE